MHENVPVTTNVHHVNSGHNIMLC